MQFQKQLLTAQAHLATNDPVIADLIVRYGDCQIRPHTDYYSELVTSIVGQQLSIKAAAAIWQRIVVLAGGHAPTPKQLIDASFDDLRAAGLSGPKISYVKDLASRIEDGSLEIENITNLPNQEIIEQLTAVKGIGEWSAHMFMIFALGRLDILPYGDLGIRKAATVLYELPGLASREDLEAIEQSNKWQPYQSIASWYLWKSLENTGIRMNNDT